MPLTAGTRLGPYEIVAPLGVGAMGEVYRARHLKLRRDVAIKVLPPELASDPERLARFEREARTASALNHPNIVVIHDIAVDEGVTYIAMELVEGHTLRELMAGAPLPLDRALRLASQLADGLAKAHAAGVVHRDIKPANVMVTADDLAKILDFGLAKPLRVTQAPGSSPTSTLESREGVVVGTPLYMSPEQVSGDRVDHRSDQFALGVLLYEMVGGRPPFEGPSLVRTILVADPPPLKRLRPDAPAELERIIRKCLEKDPANRFLSTTDLAAELHQLNERRARAKHGLLAALKRPAVAATLVVVGLALGATGVVWARGSGERWARDEALVEIASLTESGNLYEAYRTARRAQQYRADDPAISKALNRISLPIGVNTEPAGAEVWIKGYATPDAPWEPVGVTPLAVRIPYALMRWRITMPGYEAFEGAPYSGTAFGALAQGLILDSIGTLPPGMVRIPRGVLIALPGARPQRELPEVELETFLLDRYEVTNREFRAFVDAGGYEKQQYWPVPIERDGRRITWKSAIGSFRDATGRPGPSTWEAGSYAAGEDDHPVGGVSWYEALAYCTFAGKTLPTVYHWFHAIGQEQVSDILTLSNVDNEARAPVGRFKGLSAYGTYDMAGNVKEWAWNSSGDHRYILGGAWNEPSYLFEHLIRAHPLERAPTHGVRCAKYPTTPAPHLLAPVTPQHQYDRPAPIDDDAFTLLRGMYAYDRTPLGAEVVRVEDTLPNYRKEVVSINTAYGERMDVHLLIPRDVSPPYQSVIWFPGGDVYLLQSSESFASEYLFDFIPRGGRVLVYPIYKGMYERFEPPDMSPSAWRDMTIRWSQDVSRTIDYLETRSDFDARRIGYYGFSSGATQGPVITAVEPRIAASILLAGGLIPMPMRPEMHPVHFAPRSRTPTLMINGRADFLMPYELSQRPFFAMLGAPDDKKRHAVLDGGHIPPNRAAIIREVLDWLDRHLGPVQRVAP